MSPSVQYDAHDGRTSGQNTLKIQILFKNDQWGRIGVLSKFIFGIKHCGNWYGKVQTQIRTYPNIFSF